ncbi:hypothetical protein [Veronia nyctiphanis]|nr:hypothetical protein [Veronia nyctiphanis]
MPNVAVHSYVKKLVSDIEFVEVPFDQIFIDEIAVDMFRAANPISA